MNIPYDNSPDNSNDILDIYIFGILNMYVCYCTCYDE